MWLSAEKTSRTRTRGRETSEQAQKSSVHTTSVFTFQCLKFKVFPPGRSRFFKIIYLTVVRVCLCVRVCVSMSVHACVKRRSSDHLGNAQNNCAFLLGRKGPKQWKKMSRCVNARHGGGIGSTRSKRSKRIGVWLCGRSRLSDSSSVTFKNVCVRAWRVVCRLAGGRLVIFVSVFFFFCTFFLVETGFCSGCMRVSAY